MKKIGLVLRASALVSLIVTVFGCGGGDPPYSPINVGSTQTADFTVATQNPSTPYTFYVQSSASPASETSLTTTGRASRQVTAVGAASHVKPGGGTSTTSSDSFPVTIASLNGFDSPVTLSATNDQGSTAFTTSFGSTTVTPAANGTITTTFLVALDLSDGGSLAPVGSYSFTITAKSGTLTHIATVHPAVKVALNPGFSLMANPSTRITLFENELGEPSATTTFAVTLTAEDGFTGTINLGTPSFATEFTGDFTFSYSQPYVTLTTSQPSATVQLTVTITNSETPEGPLNVGLTGTASGTVIGNITEYTTIELNVGQADTRMPQAR